MGIMTGITRDEAKMFVGVGWSGLVDEVYDRLPSTARVSQVKEKLGRIRIYVFCVPIKTLDFLDDIERRSGEICEHCGKVGKAVTIRGWIKTLCEGCTETWKKEE